MHKKLLFLVTEDWYFISHRLQLAIALKQNGFEINVACKDTGKLEEISSYGFKCYSLKINRGYPSLFEIIKNIREIKNVLKRSEISIIHAVSIQSIILAFFSTIFNRKIKLVAAVTGLGSLFLAEGLKNKVIRSIIKIFLIINFQKNNINVIVQNKDDKKYLNKNLFCSIDKITIIRGSGIDTKYYTFQKEPKNPPIVLTFIGRIIKDKGIEFLIESFKLAYKKNNNIKLLLVGSLDDDNVSSIDKNDLDSMIINHNIEYLGEKKNIRNIWEKSHIAILPSKREGLPKSLLEAAACGRAIISTNVPGCREIAINGVNAKLVNFGNVRQLSKAILFLSENHLVRKSYGLKSRELVESDMSEDKVIKNTLSFYKKLN